MKTYTVKDVAEMSGVSVRTLHHYDAIGLLKPAAKGENGYRIYRRTELLRLQQILFYRELGFTLTKIADILDNPDFDIASALATHKRALSAEADRFKQLIATIDRTMMSLSGKQSMSDADLYRGFSPEQQSDYEQWLIEKYGGDMATRIDQSKKAFNALDDAERESVMAELADIEQSLAEGLRRGEAADSEVHDLLLERHRAWVAFMWDRPCDMTAYAGLADLYLSHPDFEKRYEQIEAGFTAYLTDAMKTYTERYG